MPVRRRAGDSSPRGAPGRAASLLRAVQHSVDQDTAGRWVVDAGGVLAAPVDAAERDQEERAGKAEPNASSHTHLPPPCRGMTGGQAEGARVVTARALELTTNVNA